MNVPVNKSDALSTGLITALNRDHRVHKNRTKNYYFHRQHNPSKLRPSSAMIPTNAKQSTSIAISRRSVVLAKGCPLTIRVSFTPAADLRQGCDRQRHPCSRTGKSKATATKSHDLGGTAPRAAGIAKDGASRGRRRNGRRLKRRAGRAAAAVAVVAATASAVQNSDDRPAAACAGEACLVGTAAASPPFDDVLCELRDLCL